MGLKKEYKIHIKLYELLKNKIDLSKIRFEFAFYSNNGEIVCLEKNKKYIKGVEFLGDCFTDKELTQVYKEIKYIPKYKRLKNISSIYKDIEFFLEETGNK